MDNESILNIDEATRSQLSDLAKSRMVEVRMAQRADIILMFDSGVNKAEIGRSKNLDQRCVATWINRFKIDGIDGLSDRPGRGRKEGYSKSQKKKIVDAACKKPKKGLSRWSVRTLASHLGIDKDKVHRVLREHDLHPHRLRTFNFSPDPQFEEKLLDVVGLYMNPPENAMVLCMDEKTGIQALDRTQPLLPLRSKKPKAWSNEYVRHGTRTMLAAVEIATGRAITWVNKTRKSDDFVTFMNQVVKKYPNQRLCVVMDNLNTHKGKAAQKWLEGHPLVTFHYTPTHASWVNLAECFFSILSKQALEQAVHKSDKELEKALDAFSVEYNKTSKPFVWTKGPEKLTKIIELTKEFQRESNSN